MLCRKSGHELQVTPLRKRLPRKALAPSATVLTAWPEPNAWWQGFLTFPSRIIADFTLTVFLVKDKVLVSEAKGYSELGGGDAGKAVRVVRLFVINHEWKCPKFAPAGAVHG